MAKKAEKPVKAKAVAKVKDTFSDKKYDELIRQGVDAEDAVKLASK